MYNINLEDDCEREDEAFKLFEEGKQHNLLRTANKLKVPINAEEWTTEHKRQYLDSDEYVWNWLKKQELRDSLAEEDRCRLVVSLRFDCLSHLAAVAEDICLIWSRCLDRHDGNF